MSSSTEILILKFLRLGSLTFYRRVLKDNVFCSPSILTISRASKQQVEDRLPTIGHGIAGIMAGATVSLIAAPVEHIKARLQVQYAANKSDRLYSGPVDCIKKIVCDSCQSIVINKYVLTQHIRPEPTGYGACKAFF